MKKFLLFNLAILTTLLLTGCGDKKLEEKNNSNVTVSKEYTYWENSADKDYTYYYFGQAPTPENTDGQYIIDMSNEKNNRFLIRSKIESNETGVHEACLYYNGKLFCLENKTFDKYREDGALCKAMDSALGKTHTKAEEYSTYKRCYYESYYCNVEAWGQARCGDSNSNKYCEVDKDVAYCAEGKEIFSTDNNISYVYWDATTSGYDANEDINVHEVMPFSASKTVPTSKYEYTSFIKTAVDSNNKMLDNELCFTHGGKSFCLSYDAWYKSGYDDSSKLCTAMENSLGIKRTSSQNETDYMVGCYFGDAGCVAYKDGHVSCWGNEKGSSSCSSMWYYSSCNKRG